MKRVLSAAALLFFLFAIFWRLDGVPLWRDEATTAVWGRLMAETGTGLPYAFDSRTGQLLVQDDDGHDVNSQLLPGMQSYLQFYISAAGHAALGDGTLEARLPFALLGLGALALLYWLGRLLAGPWWLRLALPVSACLSIYFIHAARQGRYYIIVVFATALLFVQVARYLRKPELGERWMFYVQLGLIGCLLYAGNYLSFAATWFALGLFLLITDRPALLRLCGVSAVLAVGLGIEFWLLHAEFLTEWRPGSENTFWENFRYVVARRGREYWRWLPFVFLVPAGVALLHARRPQATVARKTGAWLVAVVPLAGFVVPEPWLRGTSDPAFVLFGLCCLAAPGTLLYLWTKLRTPGVQARMALLAGLVVVVCPLFTIAVAGRATLPRYYYQTCPAAVVLVGLAACGLHRAGRAKLAAACFVGASLWPNLDLAGGGTDQVVLRQYLRDDSYNGPLLRYLRTSAQPGDTLAFYRNVKGMVAYYYLPDLRWVNQLDADMEYNRRFRRKIPDDQFDDAPAPDWFVLWDTRERQPKMLDERYELVWEHTYSQPRGVWELGSPPRERSYQVHRRR